MGLIPPLEFVALCEETGLIIQIGRWVLEQACRQVRTWQKQFQLQTPLSVSVNLSVKQLTYENIVKQIDDVLRETPIDPSCLNLEITESMLMEDPDSAVSTLRQIKALGVSLSVDDFGTGYSSLSYLHQLPVDNLKIDRSFVNKIQQDSDSVKVVQTIVWLAQHLGLATVAEGIETPEQLSYLRDVGCQYGQGYLFSKPLSCDAAGQLIDQSDGIAPEIACTFWSQMMTLHPELPCG